MRTVVISDCHIGAVDANTASLLAFLEQLECDRLLIAGDLWELWTRRLDYLNAHFTSCIWAFERLKRRRIKVEYLLGNHDESYLRSPLVDLSVLPVVTCVEIQLPCGKRLAVIHGHEYDHLIKWHYPLMRLGYWVKQVLGELVDVDKASVSSKKGHARYSNLVSAMHWEARQAYKRLGYAGLIMGHTHAPIYQESSDFLFVDAGDWKGSNTFVEIEGDRVELKSFQLK